MHLAEDTIEQYAERVALVSTNDWNDWNGTRRSVRDDAPR
jgi:hypothetical protein